MRPSTTATAGPAGAGARPILPPEIEERFLPASRPVGDRSRLVYRPRLIARARVHFVKAAAGVDQWQERAVMATPPATDSPLEWKETALDAIALESAPRDRRFVRAGAGADPAPQELGGLAQAARGGAVSRPAAGAVEERRGRAQSGAGESEGDFRARLAHLARERRDREVEELRRRYAPKIAALQDKVRRGEERVEREQSQVGRARLDTAISIGATIAGALFGRKLASVTNVTRARSTLRGAGRASRARRRRGACRARRRDGARGPHAHSKATSRVTSSALERSLDPTALELERIELAPRKTDVEVASLVLLWTPWRVDDTGIAEPLYDGE